MLRPVICLLIILLFSKQGTAQFTDSITNKIDSSYSNYRAYLSTKKTHPNIQLVEFSKDPSVRQQKNIVYSRIGKRKLLIDVFSAVKQHKSTIPIIMIHGGGWRSGNRAQHFALLQRLAGLGYTCFAPEYRLSTEALFPAAVYDVKAAIRWVRANAKKYNVDTGKITIMGFSAGGELAALMATTGNMPLFEGCGGNAKFSSKVNALIDIDGTLSFVHPESAEGNDEKRLSASTMWFGYSKKQHLPLLTIASPLTHANEHTPPTLFINSAVDRMHAGRSDFISILNSHGIYTEVKTFEGSPHSFCLFEPWFEPTVAVIHGFLNKLVPGG
ncbi:MAG: alpha/beta hydrolase [Chitinophagaceae bacterium]|nr:MAG: alpha/beta hydrolase [Chitinophagaceae bacterium]